MLMLSGDNEDASSSDHLLLAGDYQSANTTRLNECQQCKCPVQEINQQLLTYEMIMMMMMMVVEEEMLMCFSTSLKSIFVAVFVNGVFGQFFRLCNRLYLYHCIVAAWNVLDKPLSVFPVLAIII